MSQIRQRIRRHQQVFTFGIERAKTRADANPTHAGLPNDRRLLPRRSQSVNLNASIKCRSALLSVLLNVKSA
jgi:hypothetical protein